MLGMVWEGEVRLEVLGDKSYIGLGIDEVGGLGVRCMV